MNRLRGAWLSLCLTAGATTARALSRPAPGTDAALHGHAAGPGMKIGFVVAVAVAIATALWWGLSHRPGGGTGR